VPGEFARAVDFAAGNLRDLVDRGLPAGQFVLGMSALGVTARSSVGPFSSSSTTVTRALVADHSSRPFGSPDP
jgi:hypothetical protein